jgi:phosphatidate cytidylyltransferase
MTIFALLWRVESAIFFISFLVIASAMEFFNLFSNSRTLATKILDSFVCFVVFCFIYVNQGSLINAGYLNLFILPAGLIYLGSFTFRKGDDSTAQLQSSILSWVYIAIPLGFFLQIGQMEFGTESANLFPYNGVLLLFVFVFIWSSDTFAYLLGRKFGKNPLAPSISPKKTWEGLIGGTLCTMLIAFLISNQSNLLTPKQWVLLSLIICIFGALGDLFESKIKRILGVKDSGTSLPGHGGFLDRFDSILFAGPAAYIYLSILAM